MKRTLPQFSQRRALVVGLAELALQAHEVSMSIPMDHDAALDAALDWGALSNDLHLILDHELRAGVLDTPSPELDEIGGAK